MCILLYNGRVLSDTLIEEIYDRELLNARAALESSLLMECARWAILWM